MFCETKPIFVHQAFEVLVFFGWCVWYLLPIIKVVKSFEAVIIVKHFVILAKLNDFSAICSNDVKALLRCYTNLGCMRLHGAVVGIDGENNSLFTITVDGKVFHLQVSGS